MSLLSHSIKCMKDTTKNTYDKSRNIGLNIYIKNTKIMKVMTRKCGAKSVVLFAWFYRFSGLYPLPRSSNGVSTETRCDSGTWSGHQLSYNMNPSEDAHQPQRLCSLQEICKL